MEAFQWLAQEVVQAKGEALIMQVEQFEGLTDSQIVEQFHESLKEEYGALLTSAGELEKALQAQSPREWDASLSEALQKLQKRLIDLKRIDYFNSPDEIPVTSTLARIKAMLIEQEGQIHQIETVTITDYQGRQWVTRPRPHVDRLACIWLIRRFIDANAEIRYSQTPDAGEISFDMSNATFGHHGNLCSFETMLYAFQLDKPGLSALAEIIHEIDLRDGLYQRPETEGVATVLKGWQLAKMDDQQLEANGLIFFDGLYASLNQ